MSCQRVSDKDKASKKAGKATAEAAGAAPRRRSNATRACAPCRRRKAKCDGALPCSTCTAYHDDCSYTTEQDARRPANKAYVAALEERVKMLESLLKQQHTIETADTMTGQSPDWAETVESDTESALDRLRLDEETYELLHYGPTSAYQHLPELQSATRDDPLSFSPPSASPIGLSTSPSTFSSFQTGHSRVALDSLANGPMDWSRNLPADVASRWDGALHQSVLAHFFSYFNCWCYWLDPHLFLRDMAACLDPSASGSARTAAYSPLLHNAVLSVGCFLSGDERLQDGADGKALAARAKALLEDEGERPMLSAMQGLLLLGSYHSGAGLQTLGFLWSGLAFRMSHTLGLALRSDSYVARGVLTAETKRARDRTIWCAYVQDKLWSSYVGRTPAIPRSSLETQLPPVDEQQDREPWDSPGSDAADANGPSFISSTFHWTCRLAIIEEQIMCLVYGRVNLYSARVLNRVSEIHLELETWASSLPNDLHIAPQTQKAPPPHIIILNCMYHFCLILLYRPYYVRHSQPTQLEINEIAIKRCNASAIRIVALFELFQRSPGLRFAPVTATQIAFAAATTHLLALVNAESAKQPKRVSDAREAVRACGVILREMGQAFKSALQWATIFDTLVEKSLVHSPSQPASQTETADIDSSALAQAQNPQSDLPAFAPAQQSVNTGPAVLDPTELFVQPSTPSVSQSAPWTASSPAGQPLPDDMLAILMGAEGRGAYDSVFSRDNQDSASFFGSGSGTAFGTGTPSAAWFSFGFGGQ